MDEPGMTDAQINRAIAEKLEPPPEDQAGCWKEDEYYGYSSPMRLWWVVYDDDTEDCAVTPSEFDKDPAAMIALIEEVKNHNSPNVRVWHWFLCALREMSQDETPLFGGDFSLLGAVMMRLCPLFVRDAAAKALEVI